MVKTTVKMAENGRVVIPQPVRETLEVDGESAILEIDVELADEN